MIVDFPDITIEIDDHVLEILRKHTQYSGMNEAGGILLGKYIPEKEYYYITMATEPTEKDSAGPLWFIRNHVIAQERINEQWNDTDGIINYLGEWHTHPWQSPKPSIVDRNLLKKIVKDRSNVWKYLIMIIVGLNNTFYIGVCDSEHKGKITNERIVGE